MQVCVEGVECLTSIALGPRVSISEVECLTSVALRQAFCLVGARGLKNMAGVTLDSEAAFKERALKVGLTAANHSILEGAGYSTFGSLAFAVSASPNSVTEEEVRDWIRTVFTPQPEHHQVSCLRRLLFEAQALSISDMKNRVEPVNDFVTKKMPVAERLARQKAQEARLTGVHLFLSRNHARPWGRGPPRGDARDGYPCVSSPGEVLVACSGNPDS